MILLLLPTGIIKQNKKLTKLPTITLEDAQAELCRRDFFYFLQTFIHVTIRDEIVWNWHIKYLCDKLQEYGERVINREPTPYEYLLINVPPGSSKSTIACQFFPLWLWINDITLTSITLSHTEALAVRHASRSRDITNDNLFKLMFPYVKTRGDMDNKKQVGLEEGGSRIVTSVGGSITGDHGHIIIIDDPLSVEGAVSDADRESANDFISQTLPTRKKDKKTVPTIIIMQRLHELDPCGMLLDKMPDKCEHICLPAEESGDIKPTILRKKYIDGLLDPVRMDMDVLSTNKKQLGSYSYAGQFQQRPSPEEGGLLRKSYWKAIEPTSAPVSRVDFVIDAAYTADEKNDPSVIMAYSFVGGNMYVRAVAVVRMEFPDLIKFIPEWVHQNGYRSTSVIRVEPKACFYGDTLVKTQHGYTPIKHIKKGEIIPTINELTGEIEYKKILKKFSQSLTKHRQKIYIFELNDGQLIQCTHDHLLYFKGSWHSASSIAERIMEIHSEHESEIHSVKHGARLFFSSEKTKSDEAINVLSRVCEDSDNYKSKINNYQNTQRSSKSIYSKSTKLPTSKSHRLNKRQQCRIKSGMVQPFNEYASCEKQEQIKRFYKGCNPQESTERRTKRISKINIRPSFRNQTTCRQQVNVTKTNIGEIQNQNINDSLRAHKRLEAFELKEENVIAIRVENASEVMYDISVEDNHNFFITTNDYLAHNSGKDIVSTLKKSTNLNIKEAKNPTKDKEARVKDVLAPIEAGRVYLVKGGWNDEFIEECAVFPNGRHDDQVDCVVMAASECFKKGKLKFYA